MDTTTRAGKGTVSVTADKGWLRLRWRHAGKRFSLYIGLPDTRANRKIAEAKATKIELDLKSGHFDPTLKVYKLQSQGYGQLGVVDLFNRFIQYKAKTVASATLDKYHALSACLKDYFKEKPALSIGVTEVEKFTDWYNSQKLSALSYLSPQVRESQFH
jgi:integrase